MKNEHKGNAIKNRTFKDYSHNNMSYWFLVQNQPIITKAKIYYKNERKNNDPDKQMMK